VESTHDRAQPAAGRNRAGNHASEPGRETRFLGTLGPELFNKFLEFVEPKTAGLAGIETTYLTRAWAARRS